MSLSSLKKKFRAAVFSGLTALGLMAGFNARAGGPGDGGPAPRLFDAPGQTALFGGQASFAPLALRGGDDDDDDEKRWRFKFYVSHAYSIRYLGIKTNFQDGHKDITFDRASWAAPHSNDWYKPKTWTMTDGNNPLQIFSGSSNAYSFALESDRHVLFVSIFNPRLSQQPRKVKRWYGAVDGSHLSDLEFSGDASTFAPTEGMDMNLNSGVSRVMEFEAGYGRRFQLIDLPIVGSVHYVPALAAGVQAGPSFKAIVDNAGTTTGWKEKYNVQGVGGSIRNKLEWTLPNDKFGIFYENKLSIYHRHEDLQSGTRDFVMAYAANSLGLTVKLGLPKRDRD